MAQFYARDGVMCRPRVCGSFPKFITLMAARRVGLSSAVMRPNDLTRHSDSKPKLPVITGPALGWKAERN